MRSIPSARLSAAPGAGWRLLADGQGQPKDAPPPDPQPVQGKLKIPIVATDHEVDHGRDITWMLRARQAPEHISEARISISWIVEGMASANRDGSRFRALTCF